MALSLLCGGLGVAEAAVRVNDDTSGAYEVLTKQEVTDELNKKVSKEVADLTYAKTSDVYTKTDANDKFATKDALRDLKDTVDTKADKTYVDTAVAGAVTTAGTNVEAKLVNYATKTEVDGMIAHEENARNNAITNAIGLERTDRDAAIGNAINGEANARNQAINTAITQEVTARDLAVTNAKTDLQHNITAEETARKEADTAFNTRLTTAEGKIGANETAIGDLKAADTALEGKITKNTQDIATLNGKVATAEGNITDLKAKDTDLEKKIQTNANNIQTNSNAIADTNKRTGGIARNLEGNQTTIEESVKVDKQGNVKDVNELSAKTITTTGNADLKGNVTLGTNTSNTVTVNGNAEFNEAVNMDKGLTVDKGLNVTSGESNLKNTTVDGTLSVNKETTLNGKLTANDEATFTKKVTMENDLEVKGELKTDKIAMENKKTDADGTRYNSATTITADGITHNGEVEKSGVITKSQFTHTEEGSETYAKKGNTANWTETRSDVKADGVKTKVEDSKKNRTNTSQTADGIKGYATDKDGNKTYTKVTATENSFQVQDKDGKNKNHQVNTMGSSVTEIKNDEGKITKTEQTAENITNTAKDGTIKNDAKDIVNNASGNISNKSQTMDTTVTGKATESYGSLDTTVNGNETHIVKGTKTETVDGKVTENYNAGQATKVTGNQDIHVTGKQTNTVEGGQENIISGGQINSITGDQTTTVTGDISNKAKNITNEAETKLTDKVGTNTRVLDSEGITDTVPGADGKGSTFKQRIDAIMGNVKTDAGESEVTQTGDEITSKVGLGEATNSRVTQKKNLLEAAVTDGTNYNISNDTANESAKELRGGTKVNRQYDNLNGSQKTIADGANTNLSIDTASASAKALTDGTKVNKQQDNLDSSEKTITNGTYKTSKVQTALDITNTAKDGTITNDAKNIVNNATGDMTNTVGGKQTNKIDGDQVNTIGGSQTTTVTGDISNTAKNITNEANTKLTDKVGTNTRVLDSEGITDTVPGADGKGSTFKQRIDAIMGNVKTDAGESEVTQKGDEITSVVGKGEATNSRVTQKKGSLEAMVTDGTNINDSYDVANASAKVLSGGTKVNKLQDNLDSSEKTITNGTYTTSKLQTALDITNTAKDGTITNDAKNIVNNATGDMTNTVGGKLTTTVTGQATENFKGGLKTDITGEEIHTVTGNQTNKVTGKQTNTVEGGQENIISGGQINNITGDQTTTISGTQTTTATDIKRNASSGMIDTIDNDYGTNTETKVAGKTTTDVSIKGTGEKGQYIRGANESRDYLIKGTLKNSETKTVEKTSTEITDGTNKASTIQDAKNLAGSVTNGTETGVSGIHANDDGSVSIDSGVTDGTNTSVQKQTASAIATDVKDGAGNENASVATATTSANTIKSGSKANTVISTADGTSFINSEAAAPVTGASGAGTAVNTTIKGNTITTGKVTMDYAEVMKDLGVHGNAKVDQNLEVGGTSTLKGDVTMESNATVNGNFSVGGNTNLKNTEVDGTLNVTQKATFGDSVSIAKDLSVGGDVTANSYKVGDKTYIDANGIHANDQKITNVADGSISEGSKDAVNGGQLYGVKRDLEHQVDKVGANAAAMANLRPMEFDPSSKWNIAAAIGNYGSETAAALGAFYRPNDDVMVNLSTAFGTGENMVGGGVSVRLGKGGNKLSREETNALKDQVNDLTARMDALLSVLNPNMSKDFPDVPENHWAYEAVSRLAGNDIVQGYPDGEFHGERTMTRYEMAEIIYNALSRGAEAEKELVEEFKPELQAMAASEKATAEKAEG